MLFKERAKLALAALAKRPEVTLEQARAQVRDMKNESNSKIKKGAKKRGNKPQL